jgi:extradiol dioxygenase family protein
MLVNQLFHIAIRSANIGATRRFHVDVLGMALTGVIDHVSAAVSVPAAHRQFAG